MCATSQRKGKATDTAALGLTSNSDTWAYSNSYAETGADPGMNDRRQGGEGVTLAGPHELS